MTSLLGYFYVGKALRLRPNSRGNWSGGSRPSYGIMFGKTNHTRRLPPMPAYHKNVKQSNKKSEQKFFMPQPTLLDIQEAAKGRFTSFCTAVGARL